MQQQRNKSKSGIIIIAVVAVVLIAIMIVWQRYEAAHRDELKASVLTTDVSELPSSNEEPQQPAKPARVIPNEPDKLLVMAEDALKDEGYFEENARGKGFHVYFLLKKCLDCKGSPDEVEPLAKRLKARSDQDGYGPWHVESADLADLDERINTAKQM